MQPERTTADLIGQPTTALAKNMLLAEFIHRSANDFAVACAEIHIAGRETTYKGARDRLETVVGRLHALASIQRLLQPPTDPVIELSNQFCELCHFHSEARFAELGAFVYLSAGDIRIDAQRGWILLLIASELLTNAARHAFEKPGGIVHVEVVDRNGEIICIVRDDGIGLGQSRRGRAGSAIVAALAHEAGITFEAHPCSTGSKFELRIPIEPEL